jgi:hypothetical protein
MVMKLEIFLQTLYSYFANSPKKDLQLTKLVEFMETKEMILQFLAHGVMDVLGLCIPNIGYI